MAGWYSPAPPTLTSVTPNTGVQGITVPAVFAGTNLLGGTLNLPTGITLSGAAAVTATLERMATPAEPCHSPSAGSASFKRAYAMTNKGNPACHRV